MNKVPDISKTARKSIELIQAADTALRNKSTSADELNAIASAISMNGFSVLSAGENPALLKHLSYFANRINHLMGQRSFLQVDEPLFRQETEDHQIALGSRRHILTLEPGYTHSTGAEFPDQITDKQKLISDGLDSMVSDIGTVEMIDSLTLADGSTQWAIKPDSVDSQDTKELKKSHPWFWAETPSGRNAKGNFLSGMGARIGYKRALGYWWQLEQTHASVMQNITSIEGLPWRSNTYMASRGGASGLRNGARPVLGLGGRAHTLEDLAEKRPDLEIEEAKNAAPGAEQIKQLAKLFGIEL
ncbi:hypothetical protein GW756_03845 [bacterium]|nr:hypothetical protein [bacterium]NCQ55266.1 hypothetical protein [Candidatus Parcubacteria bacterium]NCS67221.1 hypothetical protein [Candidatus Peregrinibacteria bacterium]NCS96476.1 hypothetical protein [bacterium]